MAANPLRPDRWLENRDVGEAHAFNTDSIERALEQVRELKQAILRNISHEFRTPLNTIIGHADLLIDAIPQPDEEIHQSLRAIARASVLLDRNLRSVMDLSKLETGGFTLAPSTFILAHVVEQQLFEFRPEAEKKAITLLCELESPDTVTLDEYCLRQALTNVLDNAVKFTNEGQIIVRSYRDSAGRICIDIKDTGIGIDPFYVPWLFEPFSQESAGLTRRYAGLGLGLPLAKHYLALNGAELSVKSVKWQGSVFTIRLGD